MSAGGLPRLEVVKEVQQRLAVDEDHAEVRRHCLDLSGERPRRDDRHLVDTVLLDTERGVLLDFGAPDRGGPAVSLRLDELLLRPARLGRGRRNHVDPSVPWLADHLTRPPEAPPDVGDEVLKIVGIHGLEPTPEKRPSRRRRRRSCVVVVALAIPEGVGECFTNGAVAGIRPLSVAALFDPTHVLERVRELKQEKRSKKQRFKGCIDEVRDEILELREEIEKLEEIKPVDELL